MHHEFFLIIGLPIRYAHTHTPEALTEKFEIGLGSDLIWQIFVSKGICPNRQVIRWHER